jgi:hypothetical protein
MGNINLDADTSNLSIAFQCNHSLGPLFNSPIFHLEKECVLEQHHYLSVVYLLMQATGAWVFTYLLFPARIFSLAVFTPTN